MTFKQLSYFTTIYEKGSISGAAETLYISQQALCRILGALENEFGRPLFTRGRSGVCPTELGTELYRSSQPVLKEMTALEQHIQAFIRSDSKRLNIGLAAGFRYLSPSNARKLWSAFESKHPQILVQSREYHYVEGLELLENQTLDLLTFSDYTAGENYTQHPLKTWERVLLVPQGHPLYDREFVEPSDLKGERLVFSANAQVHQRFLELCDLHSCHPSEIVRVSDTLYMYEACQADHCIGITINGYFSDAFLPQFPCLKILRFREEFLPYTVSAIFRRNHPMKQRLTELAQMMKLYLKQEKNKEDLS